MYSNATGILKQQSHGSERDLNWIVTQQPAGPSMNFVLSFRTLRPEMRKVTARINNKIFGKKLIHITFVK